MTPELLQHIKDAEQLVLHPYRDVAGVPTIGYGHVIPDMDHPNITEAEADAMLIEDIEKHEAIALRLSPGLADEPPHRLDAITDFCFNLGGGAYGASVLRLRVNSKQWMAAAEQIKRWVYATNAKTGKKEIMVGLVKRRDVEANWLVEDSTPAAA